ncbi:hypothetical protein JJB09_03385 [Rhizobium sp. KVB221]|uniref:Chitinase n=1 Tax=Rhizobium setariae TaxID=2801340 RepID=A0A937CL05_9HYPH|nr:hypothetical protein [Rhizobium setariae]MBL0371061.1 hypothetical protein [Rhizobium setariae]
MNRAKFYSAVRSRLFGGKLSRSQVAGIEAILDKWEKTYPDGDLRCLAYMLATAFHETGRTMQPVRETFADTDEDAIRNLDLAWRKGRLNQVRDPYWRKDAEGKSWLGRGLVQLTHKANYARLSGAVGIDLVARPERAMEMNVAIKILFAGMQGGMFTGHRLSDFFNGLRGDWSGARRVVNGTDRSNLIGGYGQAFHAALVAATMSAVEAARPAC